MNEQCEYPRFSERQKLEMEVGSRRCKPEGIDFSLTNNINAMQERFASKALCLQKEIEIVASGLLASYKKQGVPLSIAEGRLFLFYEDILNHKHKEIPAANIEIILSYLQTQGVLTCLEINQHRHIPGFCEQGYVFAINIREEWLMQFASAAETPDEADTLQMKGDTLYFQGKSLKLQGMQFKLCELMLEVEPEEGVEINAVAQRLYNDEMESDERIKNHINSINKKLKKDMSFETNFLRKGGGLIIRNY